MINFGVWCRPGFEGVRGIEAGYYFQGEAPHLAIAEGLFAEETWEQLMDQPLGSHCPGCGQDAALALSIQAFCGNDECHVMCWDPEQTLQQFADTAESIELPGWLGGR